MVNKKIYFINILSYNKACDFIRRLPTYLQIGTYIDTYNIVSKIH